MDILKQLLKNRQLLSGTQDSRGPVGIMSRGANVYNGTSLAAHRGGGTQFGRPKKNPIQAAAKRKLFGGLGG